MLVLFWALCVHWYDLIRLFRGLGTAKKLLFALCHFGLGKVSRARSNLGPQGKPVDVLEASTGAPAHIHNKAGTTPESTSRHYSITELSHKNRGTTTTCDKDVGKVMLNQKKKKKKNK